MTCPVQDGCDSKKRCEADGLCHYTGTAMHGLEWKSAVCTDVKSAGAQTQPANPKQAYGDKKLPLYLVPFSFMAHVCTALFEGKLKYGLVNWRATNVEAMTYASAGQRHIKKWENGERCDPETKVHHLANAAACCAILLDAEINGSLIDDRPLPCRNMDALIAELEGTLANLRELHGDKTPKHWTISDFVEQL